MRERVSEGKTVAIARVGPESKQDPGTKSRTPTWVVGIQALEPLPVAVRDCASWSRSQSLQLNSRTLL